MGRRMWGMAAIALVAAIRLVPASADTDRVGLGALRRVTTPGTSACPAESEPEIAVTAAGTWVAYNDTHDCLHGSGFRTPRVTVLQLLPAGGGPSRRVTLPGDYGDLGAVGGANARLSGDPDLAPDPNGSGVLLSTMMEGTSGGIVSVQVLRVGATATGFDVRALPSPSDGVGFLSDKPFVAADAGATSPYRGRIYATWWPRDGRTVLRVWDGRRWGPVVTLANPTVENAAPDVAVGPGGVVAATFATETGVAARISRDGGRTFEPALEIIPGGQPGATWTPGCLLRSRVGVRQRALKSPRVAFDSSGGVHVVAAVGRLPDYAASLRRVEDLAAGEATGRIWHASSVDGKRWTRRQVAPAAGAQWMPAIAAAPGGGVAVAWLEVAGLNSYDAYAALLRPGHRRFAAPVRLSPATAALPAAMEAMGTSDCYGIGDYIGMTSTPRGVAVVWPTTEGTTLPTVESDLYVRELVTR